MFPNQYLDQAMTPSQQNLFGGYVNTRSKPPTCVNISIVFAYQVVHMPSTRHRFLAVVSGHVIMVQINNDWRYTDMSFVIESAKTWF